MKQRDDDLAELLRRGYAYALALTHDPAAAEDVLQDAWIKILAADGPRDRPYLMRVIRSVFIDRYRRARVRLEVVLDDARAESIDVEPLPILERGLLAAALGTLRDDEREALYLQAVEGFTAQEIADETGRPRGTILALIFRAKRKLREQLAEHYRAALP
jgi:RNA polymerase sigma-70 factor (ECF subfamily)